MQQVKLLFQVFTSKILFIEWLLQVLRAITLYLLKVRAGMEAGVYAEENKVIDLRTAPPSVKSNMIYDEDVLKLRWDLCSSCEFLKDNNSCSKCGCFMKVKHKLKMASCPVGKWGKYEEKVLNGIAITK